MKLEIFSFANGAKIPDENSFCNLSEDGKVIFGKNLNPHIKWSDFPKETKSFALICVDKDCPSVGDDVNQEGKSVPADLPRVNFYHWVLANIPLNVNEIKSGEDSSGITEHGKKPGITSYGALAGINDYTGWFSGDESMKGNYGAYDGPCPPWNDELVHNYYFQIYALDVEKVDISGNFTGAELLKAIKGHIIDRAEYVGSYTLNKNLVK